jgi:hypothetical protein
MSERVIDTGITENELLQSLTAELLSMVRRPGDVTVNDLMKTTGLTEGIVRDELEKKVKAGELSKRWILDSGKRMLAYYKPDGQ